VDPKTQSQVGTLLARENNLCRRRACWYMYFKIYACMHAGSLGSIFLRTPFIGLVRGGGAI
jgi:hypothetical protein